MKSPIITLTLIALCSWLGFTAYEQANKPVPSTSNRVRDVGAVTAQSTGKSKQTRQVITFPRLETLTDITSRPLFNVSRRPIEVKEPTPDKKPTELNIMLSGIVIGHEGQIAHLRSATDQQTRALRVGDRIGDWEIQSIFPDRVVLRSGGRVETLFMQKPGARNSPSGANPSSRRAIKRSKRNSRRKYRRGRRGDQQ